MPFGPYTVTDCPRPTHPGEDFDDWLAEEGPDAIQIEISFVDDRLAHNHLFVGYIQNATPSALVQEDSRWKG